MRIPLTRGQGGLIEKTKIFMYLIVLTLSLFNLFSCITYPIIEPSRNSQETFEAIPRYQKFYFGKNSGQVNSGDTHSIDKSRWGIT